MNASYAIHPYRHEGLWVFDEGQRSAVSFQRWHAEPEEGCRVCSPTTSPDSACGRSPMADGILDGWLCPTLFTYFETAPPRLYVRAQPKGR